MALVPLLFFCLLVSPIYGGAQESPAWTSLVEAERAFAAASLAKGMRAAFLEFLAEGSVLFRPGPVPGRKWVEEHPEPLTQLSWSPEFADVSQSGDLGYTTGPWEIRSGGQQQRSAAAGHFVSIWKRQAGGPWQVVVDLGISHAAPADSKPMPLVGPRANEQKPRRGGQVAEERYELLAFDRELANSVSDKGTAQAYLRYLADDAKLFRERKSPITGKRDIFAQLSQDGHRPVLRPDKADVSNGGDLGYTYGLSRLSSSGSADGTGTSSYYVHIWKRKGGRWTLVLDIENPGPQQRSPSFAGEKP